MKLLIFLLLSTYLVACSSKKKQPAQPKKVAKKQEATTKTMTPEHKPHHPEKGKSLSVKHSKWSYTGLTGPDMWGDLQEDYVLCKIGKLQSPIDLIWTKPLRKARIEYSYKDTTYNLVDNGHTVKASFEPGNKVNIDGHIYELVQLHFHAHSEHSISGKFYPLEAHFVHKDKAGLLAVLAVIFVEGNANPYLESMWQQFPKEKNRKVASTSTFNPSNLIPSIRTHYSYTGSLTTPPCSENVSWKVFNTPVELSREQINSFKFLYSNNFRPIQPTNKRKVMNY